MHGAIVNLQSGDGRTHNVIVVCNQMSPEEALAYAEKVAMDAIGDMPAPSCEEFVKTKGGCVSWHVTDSHLVDQVLISLNAPAP